MLFFGGGPTHTPLYFHYWRPPPFGPGAFKSFPTPNLGAIGKFLAFWTSLIRSGFAFVLGPELITIAAGESESPRRNIPKASRRFIYRLMIFYVLGALVISVMVSSDDPQLLSAVSKGAKDASASPFILGIKRAGIKGLDHVINTVILTSAWSAANSFLYGGSRSLYSLALTGQAPKVFTKCSQKGVPCMAVLFTAGLSCLTYLSVSSGSAVAFAWFLNLTTISGYIAWVVLLLAYLVSRSRYGPEDELALTCSTAFPQSHHNEQLAFQPAIYQLRSTIHLACCHIHPCPSVSHEWLPGFLPWKF